ncbi:MAG: glycosyltransferase family A protein, partial [Phycisphaerales bacterium]
MRISFVIPTRDRVQELAYTLSRLGSLDASDLGDAELIVVDNDSRDPSDLPDTLSNGIPVTHVPLNENRGTAARNIAVRHARGEWVIMLDDDSHLCPGPTGAYLAGVNQRTAAVGGEILLPDGSHEAGGLPEVFIGCGCAIRRAAFLEAGGYDESFRYYAEEYDLCAKLIARGHRVTHTRALRFEHRKVAAGRDMDNILYRLVRNNGWVIQRYAPEHLRPAAMDEMTARYRLIAGAEGAMEGYGLGLDELERTLHAQPPHALTESHWERFIGGAALREGLIPQLKIAPPGPVAIIGPSNGKG